MNKLKGISGSLAEISPPTMTKLRMEMKEWSGLSGSPSYKEAVLSCFQNISLLGNINYQLDVFIQISKVYFTAFKLKMFTMKNIGNGNCVVKEKYIIL